MFGKIPSDGPDMPTPPSKRLLVRIGDLEAFGLLSATERFLLKDYVAQGRIPEAEAIVVEKEKIALSRKGRKKDLLAIVDSYLPAGYKTSEQLFAVVPNYALYGGALALVYAGFKMSRKRNR